jgi:hypothetical protein
MKAIGIRLTVPELVDRVRSWLETEYQAYIYESETESLSAHILLKLKYR